MLNIFITNIAIIWQRKVNNTSDLVTKRKPPAGIKTLQVYVVNHQKIKNFTILRFEGLQYKDYIEPKVNIITRYQTVLQPTRWTSPSNGPP